MTMNSISLMKRIVVVIVTLVTSVALVYRAYYAVEDKVESLLPLVMCLLFSISMGMTVLASILGDGEFSGLRSPD
jgi:hypothetical protein